MMQRLAAALLALVMMLALGSAVLGVPVFGTYLGRDADFAIMALHMLSDAWAEGDPWPRWLMDTSFGLGGTTFYSYPPLAYWAAAAVAATTGAAAPKVLAIVIAVWRLASVGTGYLWLRRHVPPATALAGAAFGALLPYVALVDPWFRVAYSEMAAIALLPLLLLALERLAEGRRAADFPAVALVYAALALTNLPLCVLAAHLGPLYAWAYGDRATALRSLIAGIAGAALAAAFLLPAFGLMRHSNTADLFNPSWRDNLLFFTPLNGPRAVIWGSTLLTVGCGLWFLRVAAMRATPGWLAAPGLPRALATLLVAAFALTTVFTLPLWLAMPQLAAVEHPWRTTAFLSPAVGGLAALALAARLRPGLLLASGLGLALLTPVFLAGVVRLTNPAWPKFLPTGERLAFARDFSAAYSWEHFPAEAAAAGWVGILLREPDPYARPIPPLGTERLRDGYRVPQADGAFRLPQFYFPAWSAEDTLGPVALRASPEGFLEVAADRPLRDLVVRIRPTPWERAGWLVSGAAALGLMLLPLVERRRWRPPVASRELSIPGRGSSQGNTNPPKD
jgi:hypothetical protein